ncbi:hypothetical protein [Methylotenera sp.]|uniref:hypothetical protein n=1 Tax=Methylotenera sp. TaxID=2051956 RepID=UPI002ED94C37
MSLKLFVGGVEKQELLKQLREAQILLNPLAEVLFSDERFTTSQVRNQVEVVQVTVAALGLLEGGTFDQIIQSAASQGMALCPLELGPHLRLFMLEQAEGAIRQPATENQAPTGSITIASAELSTDEDVPKGFYLRCIEGALWLRGYCSLPGHIWSAQDVFVFLRTALCSLTHPSSGTR